MEYNQSYVAPFIVIQPRFIASNMLPIIILDLSGFGEVSDSIRSTSEIRKVQVPIY